MSGSWCKCASVSVNLITGSNTALSSLPDFRCGRVFRTPQRMDLGECPKTHDLALRADFDAASKIKDYYYDIEVSDSFISVHHAKY